MQQRTVNDLWNAIDRLIERCRTLGRDRTSLAHALSRVNGELVHERSARAQAEERCREMQVCLEESALRLERLADACDAKAKGLAHVVQKPAALPEPVEEKPELQPAEAAKKHDPLAHVVTKTWDHRNLERIVRPAEEPAAQSAASRELCERSEQDLFAAAENDRLF